MNDKRCTSQATAATGTAFVPTDSLLECAKRASLARQAQHAAWQLGALLRRVAREAPEVHATLRDAVDALLRLNLQCSSSLPEGPAQVVRSRSRPAQRPARPARLAAASQAELF